MHSPLALTCMQRHMHRARKTIAKATALSVVPLLIVIACFILLNFFFCKGDLKNSALKITPLLMYTPTHNKHEAGFTYPLCAVFFSCVSRFCHFLVKTQHVKSLINYQVNWWLHNILTFRENCSRTSSVIEYNSH